MYKYYSGICLYHICWCSTDRGSHMTKPRFKGYETDSILQRTVTLQGGTHNKMERTWEHFVIYHGELKATSFPNGQDILGSAFPSFEKTVQKIMF